MAAASQLSKMVNKLCQKNQINVINIVRNASSLKLVKDAGG